MAKEKRGCIGIVIRGIGILLGVSVAFIIILVLVTLATLEPSESPDERSRFDGGQSRQSDSERDPKYKISEYTHAKTAAIKAEAARKAKSKPPDDSGRDPEHEIITYNSDGMTFGSFSAPRAEPPLRSSAIKAEAPRKSLCRDDANCWGKKFMYEANAPCILRIQARLLYDFDWKNWGLIERYPIMKWSDKEAGHIMYGGSALMVQNRYGAYEKHLYTCVYDTANERVISASVASMSSLQ